MKYLLLGLLMLMRPGCALAAEELQTVVVKPGDTLWSISNTYLKDPKKWNVILKYNKLPSSNPSIALPGMPLRIPVTLLKEEYRAARLVSFVNEVLFRRTGTSDWQGVDMKMDLFKSDTLRTREAARADVKFYTGQILNLYPNSIVILRPPGKKNTDVQLLAGEMRGLRSRVITASARITPKTKNTEFGAKLNEDLTTMVQVYKGKADVEAQGKTVEVAAGFSAEVKMDMAPSRPVKMPKLPDFDRTNTALTASAAPRLNTAGGKVSLNLKALGKNTAAGASSPAGKDLTSNMPAAGNVNDKAIDSSEIIKMLTVANPVQGYHMQVSKSNTFNTTVLDKSYDAFEDIDLNTLLPPGDYFMRVALIDLLGFEGKFSAPRSIKLTGVR